MYSVVRDILEVRNNISLEYNFCLKKTTCETCYQKNHNWWILCMQTMSLGIFLNHLSSFISRN